MSGARYHTTMAELIQPRVLKGFRDFLPESEIERALLIETLTATLNAHPGELDLMKLLTPAKLKMVEIAKHHIMMCMSDGKAWK